MRHISACVGVAVLVLLVPGCAETRGHVDPARALADVGRPADVDFEHGSLQFSKQIPGVASPDAGRLASTSWDVYYVLDDGDVGSWGAGMDVFATPADARRAAEELVSFWVCDGPRDPLDAEVAEVAEVADVAETDVDVVEASTCRRPTGGGTYAMLSAAEGRVTANLLVAAHDRDVAAQALLTAWGSLSASTRQVAGEVG